MKYREKTVIWEAEQFRIDRQPWPAGVVVTTSEPLPMGRDGFVVHPLAVKSIQLQTERGSLELEDGDWILTAPDGTHSLATAPYFAANFEPVPEELIHAAATD